MPECDATTFGQWLRRRRTGLGLTQAELARKVGCATITVQKIEADERRPSRDSGSINRRPLSASLRTAVCRPNRGAREVREAHWATALRDAPPTDLRALRALGGDSSDSCPQAATPEDAERAKHIGLQPGSAPRRRLTASAVRRAASREPFRWPSRCNFHRPRRDPTGMVHRGSRCRRTARACLERGSVAAVPRPLRRLRT